MSGSGSGEGATGVLSFRLDTSGSGSGGGATGVLSSGVGLSCADSAGLESFPSGGAQLHLTWSRDGWQGVGSGSLAGTTSGSPRVPSGIPSTCPDGGASCAFKGMVLSVSFEGCASNNGGALEGFSSRLLPSSGPRHHKVFRSGRGGKRKNPFFGNRRSRRFLGWVFFRICPRSPFPGCTIEGQSSGSRGYESFLLVRLLRSTFLGWPCCLRLRRGGLVRIRRRRFRLWSCVPRI